MPLGASPASSVMIGIVLVGFAASCAFAAESWHVAANCFEHRIGIGRCTYMRRYRDAELVVINRFAGKWGMTLIAPPGIEPGLS
jgi:hypothetical protein